MLKREFILKVFKTTILIVCVLFRVFLGKDTKEAESETNLKDLQTNAFEKVESEIEELEHTFVTG